MKKIVSSMMMLFVLLSAVTAMANPLAPKSAEVGMTAGVVDSIEGNRIVIKGEGNYKEIALIIAQDTHVVNGADGAKVELGKLKKGDKVAAYYGTAVTRSLPPQGKAKALVIGDDKERAMYMKAGSIEKLADGDIRVLDTNGDRLVRIGRDQVSNINAINEGSELLVWYKMMTMSLPGQATSTKTVVLSSQPDIKVHLLAGVIAVNGAELQENIIVVDDTVYLPLRSVCEKLGYDVQWNQENKSIMAVKGARTASLTVGSQEYAKMKMRVRLDKQPQMINGKTFVPAEFFSEVMDLNVEILKTHR